MGAQQRADPVYLVDQKLFQCPERLVISFVRCVLSREARLQARPHLDDDANVKATLRAINCYQVDRRGAYEEAQRYWKIMVLMVPGGACPKPGKGWL